MNIDTTYDIIADLTCPECGYDQKERALRMIEMEWVERWESMHNIECQRCGALFMPTSKLEEREED